MPRTRRIVIGKLLSLSRGERGATLVEFAMSALALLVLIIGAAAFGVIMYGYHFASWAAQQGARYAMVRGADFSSNSCSTSAPPSFTLSYACEASTGDIENYVKNLAAGAGLTNSITTTASFPGSTPCKLATGCPTCTSGSEAAGCYVSVQVKYSYNFPFSFLPKATEILTATSEKVIQE